MLTDYHMHLQPDGTGARAAAAHAWEADGGHLSPGWIGRYAERARARAVSEIAITEHVYRFAQARDWNDDPWWREEATEDVDAYCAAVLAAREAGLPVLLGIEMDWLAGRRDEIAAFLDARPFDVVLGSVHWIGALVIDNPAAADWGGRPAEEVWRAYLAELVAAAAVGALRRALPPRPAQGVRHPHAARARVGSSTRPSPRSRRPGWRSSARRPACASPSASSIPRRRCWRAFGEAGVPATLSSDAHQPGDVARDYATAVAALRGAGYETITRFSRREPAQGHHPMGMRIGAGADAHRFGPGRPLMLGTVQVPHDEGLVGHSDGDVVAHALCDALLAAAGEPDIGVVFPPGDPAWEGASGARLLRW